MAFTESQQLDICTILEVEKPILDQALIYNDSFITLAVETKVIEQITRWATAGSNFVNVHPRERNYGVEIKHETEKADIRRTIATLLLMTKTVYGGSGGSSAQVRVSRG